MNRDGSASSHVALSSGKNGMPLLTKFEDRFNGRVTNVGDLDGDGVTELAVGEYRFDIDSGRRAAVDILFLNSNGTVKSSTRIASEVNGGPVFADQDSFGFALAPIGDLNGDGVNDLAVGAHLDDTGGAERGAVHLLFLNTDGTVESSVKIASGTNGGPQRQDLDGFGTSIANVGDIDGDGVPDLGVGSAGHVFSIGESGVVHLLRLVPSLPPTDITLSSTALSGLPANLPAGTLVGRFSTVDPNVGDAFTYTLVAARVLTTTDRSLFQETLY